MRRTYANNSANTRRTTILMRADDQALLEQVYKGLQKFYLHEDKPTLSAILMVTLKKGMAEDPNFLSELFEELKEACKKKPRINPWTDKDWA